MNPDEEYFSNFFEPSQENLMNPEEKYVFNLCESSQENFLPFDLSMETEHDNPLKLNMKENKEQSDMPHSTITENKEQSNQTNLSPCEQICPDNDKCSQSNKSVSSKNKKRKRVIVEQPIDLDTLLMKCLNKELKASIENDIRELKKNWQTRLNSYFSQQPSNSVIKKNLKTKPSTIRKDCRVLSKFHQHVCKKYDQNKKVNLKDAITLENIDEYENSLKKTEKKETITRKIRDLRKIYRIIIKPKLQVLKEINFEENIKGFLENPLVQLVSTIYKSTLTRIEDMIKPIIKNDKMLQTGFKCYERYLKEIVLPSSCGQNTKCFYIKTEWKGESSLLEGKCGRRKDESTMVYLLLRKMP